MDLQALIEPTLNGLGYELVTLDRVGRGLLRVYIDQPAGITVEDCARVSNQLTRMFMVENVDYSRLEVSSPGLDRPLVKPADFERFAGQRAQVRLREVLNGRKRYLGTLKGFQDDAILIEMDGAELSLPLAEVESARLAPELEVASRRVK